MQHNFSFPMHSQFQYTEGSYDGLLSVSPKILSAGCGPGGDVNTGQDDVSREVKKKVPSLSILCSIGWFYISE